MPGDNDERHLQSEWYQLPQTAPPGIDHLRQRRRREDDPGDNHEKCSEKREYERIGHPPLVQLVNASAMRASSPPCAGELVFGAERESGRIMKASGGAELVERLQTAGRT